MELIHSCGKEWQKVGTFTDINEIIKKYPATKWQYGSMRYGYLIDKINITTWNSGTRIFFPSMVPHGDNANSFHMGTSMYTRGTDDL